MHRLSFSIASCVLTTGVAHADDAATQQLTIPKGGIVIDGFLVANLSTDAAFKPVSLSPDVWYGVSDDITVGFVHSSVGSFGLIGEPGTSLCLTGSSNGCAGFYNNVGADLRYRLQTPLNFDGGLYLFNLANSAQLALKLGMGGRWRFDKIAVELQPSLFIYMTNRADGGTVMNGMTTTVVPPATELLVLPVTGTYAVTPEIDVGAQTGLYLPFSHTSDAYSVPLSLLGRYAVNPKLSVGLSFSLLALISKNSGFDARSLTIGGSYAL